MAKTIKITDEHAEVLQRVAQATGKTPAEVFGAMVARAAAEASTGEPTHDAQRARDRAEVAAKIEVLAEERADPAQTLKEGLGDPNASDSSSESASTTPQAATASPLRRWAMALR